MQVRRLRLLILGLVGLCILAGVALLVTVLNGTDQGPVYRGKHVAVWFREYAFSSNAPVTAIQMGTVVAQPGGGMVLKPNNGGKVMKLTGPTNLVGQVIRFHPMNYGRATDPALDALQAIGSNAVPYLVSQLRSIPFEPTYTRVFTNLPAGLRMKLPNPLESHYLRIRALDALSAVGDPSETATPILLDLLRKRDPGLQFALYSALRKLHVDRRAITQVALELGAKGRHQAAVEIAENVGWEGDDMAKYLGTVLKSADVAMRRRAIVLLEHSNAAAPASALDAILLAVSDPDPEVRYLSVRALEWMGASSPEVAKLLKSSLNDSNVMVQKVAQRMLSKMAAGATSTDAASP